MHRRLNSSSLLASHRFAVFSFPLVQHSSAYWLAKAENASLQRVYGISFPNKDKLKEWKAFMKMAEERDHRRIGQQQELFFFHKWSVDTPAHTRTRPSSPIRSLTLTFSLVLFSLLVFACYYHVFRSPGSAFFLPHGTRVYNKLMGLIKNEYSARGYQEVITPNVFNIELWKKSGHYDNYKGQHKHAQTLRDPDCTTTLGSNTLRQPNAIFWPGHSSLPAQTLTCSLHLFRVPVNLREHVHLRVRACRVRNEADGEARGSETDRATAARCTRPLRLLPPAPTCHNCCPSFSLP